jgi:hypothetical protein
LSQSCSGVETPQFRGDARRRADRDVTRGDGPDREVRARVPNIVEALGAEALDEQVSLRLTGQIARVVRREPSVEKAETVRYRLHVSLVARGGEIDLATGITRLVDQREDLEVVGEQRDVDRRLARDVGFKQRSPPRKRTESFRGAKGVGGEGGEQRLKQ